MAERDGLLIIDKPEGMTSHDVVDHVRRVLRIRRVGHTGTLDPIATGVLILCLGQATRLQQFLVGCDKEYVARIRLGFATDTYDRAGNPVTPITASNTVMPVQIQHVLESLSGEQDQIPPMYSAKKHQGRRLYRLARQGEEVPRSAVRICIDSLTLIPQEGRVLDHHEDGTTDFDVFIRCSAGTYVRSLAHDIGRALGCGGHIVALRRTAVGDFRIDQATRLQDFDQRVDAGEADRIILPLGQVPLDLPSITVSSAESDRIRRGQPLKRQLDLADGVHCRLVDEHHELLGIGQIILAEGLVQPRVVLH